jgi:hypothetical protein
MPSKTPLLWAMPTLRIFQKSNISPIAGINRPFYNIQFN